MTDIEDLALRIKALEDQVGARNATQIDSSSVDVGDDDSLVVSDVVSNAAQAVAFDIPGLQDLLDTNAQQLQDAAAAVQEAMDAADAATEAGLAAGEEASQAADDALEKAQEALDAAAAAGGGDIYTGVPPTADDAGRPGQGWYVWDSNYHVTSFYVYKDDTTKWVPTVLDDGAFGNIDAGSITSGYLGADRIAANSLTAAVFAADAITSREIAADAILARNIKAAEITGAKIAAATITGGNIAANTITAGNIKAGTITANEIAAGTITATQINLDTLNGKTINGVAINAGSFTSAGSVGTTVTINGGTVSYNWADGSGSTKSALLQFTAGSGLNSNFSIATGGTIFAIGNTASLGQVCQIGNADLRIYTSDNGDVFNVAKSNGATRIAATNDLSMTSTAHGFQIGPDNGTNLAMDNNEIMARNNGSPTGLYINGEGGTVGLGDSTSSISIAGRLNATHYAYAEAAGQATSGSSLNTGVAADISITFPSGRFTTPPRLVATAENPRVTIGYSNVTATGATIRVGNWSGGNITSSFKVDWHAVQMTSGNANG